ncbi:hypothetical protein [Yoonia sp. 208BN28-4]|uniref:hypothetical protein n=1 Tax=Yoonia sp. 208BN28-4 TaxID=3126505 RepID=UPI0030988475
MKQLVLIPLLVIASPAWADKPEVVGVVATQNGDTWRFDVTITHGDTGWDDYADGWQVLDADGQVLGTRPLAHPHVNEQPFTRSQSGIAIPDGITTVFIQVSDNVVGYYDDPMPFALPD